MGSIVRRLDDPGVRGDRYLRRPGWPDDGGATALDAPSEDREPAGPQAGPR